MEKKRMLDRSCLDCATDHKVAIDMSRSGKFDQCFYCKKFENTYKIVR